MNKELSTTQVKLSEAPKWLESSELEVNAHIEALSTYHEVNDDNKEAFRSDYDTAKGVHARIKDERMSFTRALDAFKSSCMGPEKNLSETLKSAKSLADSYATKKAEEARLRAIEEQKAAALAQEKENWEAIACFAFETKLNAMLTKGGEMYQALAESATVENLPEIKAKMQGGGFAKSMITDWVKGGFEHYEFEPSEDFISMLKKQADEKAKSLKESYVSLAETFSKNALIAEKEKQRIAKEREAEAERLRLESAAVEAVKHIDAQESSNVRVEGTRVTKKARIRNLKALAMYAVDNAAYEGTGYAQWVEKMLIAATKGKTGSDIPGVSWEEIVTAK